MQHAPSLIVATVRSNQTAMKKLLLWLVLSSADPEKMSLMVRGFLVTVISYVTVVAGLAHITLPGEELTALVNHATLLTQAFFLFVGLVASAYGAVRKFWRTLVGSNKVLNAFAK